MSDDDARLVKSPYIHVTSQMQKPNPVSEPHALLTTELPGPGDSMDRRSAARPRAPSVDAGALLCFAFQPAAEMTGRYQ